MKKIFVGLALGLFPLISQAALFTMRCTSINQEDMGLVKTELLITQKTGHLAFLYAFKFSRTSTLTDEPVGYQNQGLVERSYFQDKPTLNFSNDEVSIYQLFGQSRGYSDYKSQFHFTFGPNSCELGSEIVMANLDGTYDVDMKIGDRVVQDVLKLKGVNMPIRMNAFGGDIAGEIIVPTVFTAPLTGNGSCSLWLSRCDFKFEIMGRENGQEFKVFYEAHLAGADFSQVLFDDQIVTLMGTAKLENGEVLGTFTAVKRLQD